MAIRRLLWALLLFHAIGRMASAQEVITISGAVMTHAHGVSVPGTAVSVVGAGATAPTDASARYMQVLSLLTLAPPPPRLRVDIVFDGPPMPPRLEASAMEETTLIWAAYGVDVHMSNASDVRRDSAVRLAVKFADHPDRRMATEVLGSILFLDDVPEPAIVMYPNAIAALVSTVTLNGTSDREWPTALHDLIVGRVLGRALAHEIGHFLLRSRRHSAAGLMLVPQPVPDLVAPDRHRFVLSNDEVTRLVSITTTSFQSSPAAARPGGTPSR